MKLTLFLSSVALLSLSGCTLQKGTKVSQENFEGAIDNLPEHNYSKAKATIDYKFKDSSASSTRKGTSYWVYSKSRGWELDESKTQSTVLTVMAGQTVQYVYNLHLHSLAGQVNSYYINPLRIHFEEEYTENNREINHVEDFQFNKYGLLVKNDYKYVMENIENSYKATESYSLKVTYS